MKRTLIALLCIALPASPSSLLTVGKTPFEAFNCSVDFTPVAGADGITLIRVVSTNLQTGVDSTSEVIAVSPAPSVVGSTDVVTFRVQGGINRETHIVGARVQDNVTGEIFEGQITVTVSSAVR